MAIWDDIIPKEELVKFSSGGMGENRVGFGEKMALLIIDMSHCFVDSSFPLGDSTAGKPAVAKIKTLLDIARIKDIPIFYSTSEWRDNPVERALWKRTIAVGNTLKDPRAYEIVKELSPLPNEPVVVKFAPSAFHGTNLLKMLIQCRIDTLILTGMVTSRCVYSTGVDGFSYGFRVIIPEECVADRSLISHKVSLFNFHMKYGDVLSFDETREYLLK